MHSFLYRRHLKRALLSGTVLLPSIGENDVSVSDLLRGRLCDRFRRQFDVFAKQLDRFAQHRLRLVVADVAVQRCYLKNVLNGLQIFCCN